MNIKQQFNFIFRGKMMLSDAFVNEGNVINIDTMVLFDLEKSFQTYERKLLTLISRRQYEASEEVLMDFCMTVIQLPEGQQLFTARLFFSSFVTNLIRKQAAIEKLPANMLANAYTLIFEIEKWKNISEYMLHISWFIKRLKSDIVVDYLMFRGNDLVKQALKIINEHLQSNELSVNWLANRLEVSPTHITNLFKQYYEISASQYIAQKRIETIIELLKHSNDSLHTIRKQFSFKNHSHFIQFFKRHTGLTPLQYLQKHVY